MQTVVPKRFSVPRPDTMVDAVAKALIDYISTNQLKPGDRLPSERQLVEMTGASRLPLREALAVLKGLGIVESRHGKGVFIKELDPAAVFGMLSPLLKTRADINLDHLFDARQTIETSIAELAAVNHTEENLAVLEHEMAIMRQSVNDRDTFHFHDAAFHRELARAAGNPVLTVMMASIADLLLELYSHFRNRVAFRKQAIREHEAIMEALRARDAAAARQAVEIHLKNIRQRV
jgi:GntR family transcriptional repressor for pyruvate dehydrogenase complex